MIRYCDGNDPNLVRVSEDWDENQCVGVKYEPCACGLTFDDVNHLVIYPHERF
jgi:hypothetical protein